ncbi:iron-containing redox enzyme family protein [Francisella sp. 19X1-34]|uniref:iron-containing redox enzyme family protein n=1 Tax=Francisella sp. 19X1-34 TaxID=3087177 RepID=UPI002E301D03|nr:iron-containing redox enzyme family protein [Francisella sp. 19X1-34]MED7789591.1 iron-containing redox enzyme family protein [Francisella sp. 19X1-34]
MSDFRNELRVLCDSEWAKLKKGKFFSAINEAVNSSDHKKLLELYVRTMVEVYHYTKCNAINQAVASITVDHKDLKLLRFVLRHALEETGHENMAKRDALSLCDNEDFFNQEPLPATEAFNGYLYSVALKYGGIARLGYSFWAEDSYHQVGDLLEILQNDLKLTEKQLTFFISHAVIDEKHSKEVNDMIDQYIKTEEDKKLTMKVAQTTIYMLGKILDNVAEEVESSSFEINLKSL